MEKNSKILITGTSGMVGGALERVLKGRGYSNLLTPKRAELDLRSQNAVNEYFTQHKPEFVFHLAAIVGGIHANNTYPAKFIYENTIIHSNVIEAAYKAGVKKLLFPGSACTYPKFAPQPVKEETFLDGLIEPTNIAYAAAKINGIVMAQSYRREFGFKTIVPMPTNAYGVGDNFNPEASHVIPALMKRFYEATLNNTPKVEIWGSGTPMREFLYVDDFAEGLIFLMENYDSLEIINLSTMQEITIKDLALKIAAVTGYKGEVTFDTSKPDGAPRKCLDNSKIKSLGWQPKVNLEEGLQRMFEFHFGNK
jgi:GDP-L-fucose synthase